MKKAKLAVGVLTSLLCVGALAACNDVKYSKQGYILTYKAADGSEKHYSADDLFKSYYTDADKTQTMFDSIYKLIVKNEFTTPAKAEEYESIKKLAARDVDGDKQTAKKNADTNGTSYDTEFDSILSGKGCKDEAELLQYYIYERESKEFEDSFYEKNMDVLRGSNVKDSGKLNATTDFDGYIKTMVPYHVSHILVKVDDSSATNYWNGTIGEQDCYDLYDVVNKLAKGDESFGSIAKTYSEDEGSGASYGDLGIMDKSTSYVDEFKLGLYAYENIYSEYSDTIKDLRDNKNVKSISMDDQMILEYMTYTKFDYSDPDIISAIPYSVLSTYFNKESEQSVAKVTKGYKDQSVHEDNSLFYPRNVYYNEYFNRHAPSLISFNGDEAAAIAAGFKNFKEIPGGEDGKTYLCAEHLYKKSDGTQVSDYSPILVVRAGTSDYQGVHFITINRDPFLEKDKNDCELKDYYTTYFPGQSKYPQRTIGDKIEDQQTYVNFNNLDESSSKDRADKLKSSIQGFDTNLQKRIYQVYKDKIVFTEDSKAIGESIDNWINVSIAKTLFDDNESFDKKFDSYIDNLQQQMNERAKRLSQIAAATYKFYNDPEYGEETIDNLIATLVASPEGKTLKAAVEDLKARYATPSEASDIYSGYATWDAFTAAVKINALYNELGGLCNDGKTHK